MTRKTARTPLRLAVMMALAMFAGEMLEIFVFAAMPALPEPVDALLDALLLTVVATPFLYLFLVRPLSQEISRRRRAEEDLTALNEKLNEMNRELEKRVERQTADLVSTSAQLSREMEGRRRAADEAWKSHGLMRTLVESVPYLVMIYDVRSRRCAFVNGRVMDLLGYPPELVSAEGTDFLREILDDAAYRALITAGSDLSDGDGLDAITFEWRAKTKDGEYRSLEVRATVLRRDAGDAPMELLLTATEV